MSDASLSTAGFHGENCAGGVVYTVSKEAARSGASVVRETTKSATAYSDVWANVPRSTIVKYRGCLDRF